MTRGPVTRTIIAVWIYADVQENGDGTWTATADLCGRTVGPVTAGFREEALSRVGDLASVDPTDYLWEDHDVNPTLPT